MLKAGFLLFGEDMDDLEFRADAGKLIQLAAEEDVVLIARAEEQRQRKVLDPVSQRARH